MRSLRRVRSVDSVDMNSLKRKTKLRKEASIEMGQIEFDYK